jgi:N-acetyltransferase
MLNTRMFCSRPDSWFMQRSYCLRRREESTEMDLQPELHGTVVSLRPLRLEDWEQLFAVAADPAIWAVHPAHDRWQEPVFRRYFDEALASAGALVIVQHSDGAIIGCSRYDQSRVEPGEVEIGWTFLSRSHWGGATNRDVKALMIGHALRFCDRCVFYVGETNGRSRRAMEKIGGVLLPDRSYDFPMAGGVSARHVVYAIDAPLAQ